MKKTDNNEIKKLTAGLLRKAGFEDRFDLTPLKGGGNNREFKVRLSNTSLLLKIYFRHEHDPRDRLKTEYAFCRFAWEKGLRCVPQPFACDTDHSTALYEFIRGRSIQPEEITKKHLQLALDFYLELNSHREAPEAQELPTASEACFSVEEHLACVNERVQRLKSIEEHAPVDRKAASFIKQNLLPAWAKTTADVAEQISQTSPTVSQILPASEQRLSPSDFGFHNALLTSEGVIRFFDFEYAGWDDPAKMVCDFFCQIAVPVPGEHFHFFAKNIAQDMAEPASCLDRINLLFHVYQIKWCCIILNDFLPADSARRRFSDNEEDEETRKERQLQKVIHLFNYLIEEGAVKGRGNVKV